MEVYLLSKISLYFFVCFLHSFNGHKDISSDLFAILEHALIS